MEGVGQPCEMPGVIECWDRMLALGQTLARDRPGRLMPGSESGKKDIDSLRFPERCEELSMLTGYTSSAEGVGHT